MDYTVGEFYRVRALLLLLNPIELLLILAAPTLILWRIKRNQILLLVTIDLWVYTICAWPMIVVSRFVHFWLAGMMLDRYPSGRAVLENMLAGDSIKTFMALLFGGVLSLAYFLVWLVLLIPVILLRRDKSQES